jgi:hypothetical protein
MGKKKGMTAEDLLSSSPELVLKALAVELDKLDTVSFVLAWKPAKHSPLLIRSVMIDDRPILGPAGDKDTESPYLHELGSHHVGKTIKIAWHIYAFNDVRGVAAFAKAGRSEEWKPLKRTPGPLALGAAWKDSADFEV